MKISIQLNSFKCKFIFKLLFRLKKIKIPPYSDPNILSAERGRHSSC